MASFDVAELVGRCRRADDAALAFFYAEYAPLVERAVTRRLTSMTAAPPLRGEVQDICNEVFARIFAGRCRVLEQLRNPRSINAWLTTVAGNCTVDYVRKWSGSVGAGAALVREDPEPYGPRNDHPALVQERAGAIRECLAVLSPEEHLIIDLFFVQGLKYVEIADMLGMNLNTVSAKLRRAKAKLRKRLEELHYELIH